MKTHQFSISVTTGKKKYAPGEPVPVGGKDGVTAEEIASIEAMHGTWKGGAPAGAAATDPAQAKALSEAIQQLADREAALTAMKAVLEAQSKVDEAAKAVSGADAGDAELAALEAAEKALAEAKAAAGL